MKVGGEIEAYCTSCKAIHWHIIIAMVDARPAKVECLSCHKQHTLRTSRARARGGAPAAAKPPTVIVDIEEKLRGREKSAVGYDPKRACALDEVIRHPSFGVGLVVAISAPQRIEVQFRGGRKVLVHAQGAPAGPRLVRPKHDDDEPPLPPPDAPSGK